jgi:hypothetical protein
MAIDQIKLEQNLISVLRFKLIKGGQCNVTGAHRVNWTAGFNTQHG